MIKLFEEYNQYYTKIDEDEYNLVWDTMEILSFTKNEIKSIKSLLPNNIVKEDKNDDEELFIYTLKKKIWMRLYKASDEWYYVKSFGLRRTHQQWYKCDQFDGLLRLIEDKKKDLSI